MYFNGANETKIHLRYIIINHRRRNSRYSRIISNHYVYKISKEGSYKSKNTGAVFYDKNFSNIGLSQYANILAVLDLLISIQDTITPKIEPDIQYVRQRNAWKSRTNNFLIRIYSIFSSIFSIFIH